MSEYIITDKQLKTATEAYLEHELLRPITEVFISGDKLPQIVRCRDCIHFSEGMGTHVWLCERMEYLDLEGWTKNVRVDPNGFCAWGERR